MCIAEVFISAIFDPVAGGPAGGQAGTNSVIRVVVTPGSPPTTAVQDISGEPSERLSLKANSVRKSGAGSHAGAAFLRALPTDMSATPSSCRS